MMSILQQEQRIVNDERGRAFLEMARSQRPRRRVAIKQSDKAGPHLRNSDGSPTVEGEDHLNHLEGVTRHDCGPVQWRRCRTDCRCSRWKEGQRTGQGVSQKTPPILCTRETQQKRYLPTHRLFAGCVCTCVESIPTSRLQAIGTEELRHSTASPCPAAALLMLSLVYP